MSAHTPRCNDCHVVTGLGTIDGATLCPLHAAAPALLEALERVQHWSLNGGCWCGDQADGNLPMPSKESAHDTDCQKARAAIRAAKGDSR